MEKGTCASGEALKTFTSGMGLKERTELLDPLITRALDDGSTSVYLGALKLLVVMALGTSDREDNNGSSSQSMINVVIDMGYGLAVHAIIHLEPQVLVGVDSEGRTPLIHVPLKCEEAICKLLLEKGASLEPLTPFTSGMDVRQRRDLLDPLISKAMDDGSKLVMALRLLVQIAPGTNYGDSLSMMDAAIDMNHGLADRAIIYFELQVLVEVDTEGRTPNGPLERIYRVLECICRVLLEGVKIDIEAMKKMNIAHIVGTIHDLVKKGYKSILQLLSLAESRDAEGWTPLASAAFNLTDALCEFLVDKGCRLCLDTEQKKQLKAKLLYRIHDAARGSHRTAL